MADTDYPGIDYGMGQSNRDSETGIRYGIINSNGLMPEAVGDFEADYGDPACPECGGEVAEFDDEKHGEYPEEPGACCDYACEACGRQYDSSEVYGDEPRGHSYEGDGYALSIDSGNDVWVFKSPYYTHAQFCSPCAPGAGHLGNPCDAGPKTYALGHDWFEGRKAPYRLFKVEDGSEVLPT